MMRGISLMLVMVALVVVGGVVTHKLMPLLGLPLGWDWVPSGLWGGSIAVFGPGVFGRLWPKPKVEDAA